jgi:hypothetical protein
MHIIGFIFFFSVLILAAIAIRASLSKHGEQIIMAMIGKNNNKNINYLMPTMSERLTRNG